MRHQNIAREKKKDKTRNDKGEKNVRYNETESLSRETEGEPIFMVILGEPRTKKNHMQILGSGKRCPCCGKPQKQWIGQGSAYQEYRKTFLSQVKKISNPISYEVNIKCEYFMKTNRRYDILNLLAATDDLLVEAGVILDDNSKIVLSHDGSRVFVDKENPRCEITIEESTK